MPSREELLQAALEQAMAQYLKENSIYKKAPIMPDPTSYGIADIIETLNNTGRVASPLRSTQREALYQMLSAYGVTDKDTHALISERELITMYEQALQGVSRGKAVADKIASKYGNNPLLDPVSTKPARPKYADVNPGHKAPETDKGEYVLKSVWNDSCISIRNDLRNARSDNKAANDELKRNLTDTLLKLTEAMPDTIREQVAQALKSMTPVTLSVVLPNQAPTPLGIVHRKLEELIKMLASGGHVYLHGPAGSGKTTAARQCAEAFKLPFYFAAKVESEYMLLGFKDARGETVRTQFREAYEHGGVFLFDELDGSSPSAVVAMNAALANGICPFPDGVINMHENFKCVGGGNTKLSGATREYVGRNQLDAASVDRFDFLEWNYDDALETALATNADWCLYVQDARKCVAARALKHLVTPRATYRGCKLLEGGMTWEQTEAAVLWKGLDADTVRQIKETMTAKAPVAPAPAILG